MLARAAGVALIEVTARLEERLGVGSGVGGPTVALIAFAARARRLLRSAYVLIDAGYPDTASPLFRVMSEYLMVGRWLLATDEGAMKTWALYDLRDQRNVLLKVRKSLDDPETIASVDGQVERTENLIRGYAGDGAPLSKRAATEAGERVPSLEAMAESVGLGFAYAYGYRIMSQADVHATPLAINNSFEEADEQGNWVRPMPRYALDGYDPYSVGAHLLLDIVRPLADRIPELGWEISIAMISQHLQELSDAVLASPPNHQDASISE